MSLQAGRALRLALSAFPLSLALLVGCVDPPGAEAPQPTALLPMDGLPRGLKRSPSGAWEAHIAQGGELSLTRAGSSDARVIDQLVDPRVAFSPAEDRLVYAREGPLKESDLWQVRLPDGQPELLTGWTGSEDRPVFSPDGSALVFVSGRTGIASLWHLRLDTVPVPLERAVQLTNVDLHRAPRRPGQPPDGFVPVPDGDDLAWTPEGLRWSSRGLPHSLPVPH